MAAKTIQTDGPAFWKQLLKELEITVHSLPSIEFGGPSLLRTARPKKGVKFRFPAIPNSLV